jgi:hypothetical protein
LSMDLKYINLNNLKLHLLHQLMLFPLQRI